MKYIYFSVLGFIFTFLLLTNPVIASTPTTLFVIEHSNEFTVFLCILTLTLGTWLGVKLPNQDVELSFGMKFVSGLFGGVMAFIYCLHTDKGLTLLNPIWVGAATITMPATIMIILSKIKKFIEKYEV